MEGPGESVSPQPITLNTREERGMNIYKGKKERVEGPGLNHLVTLTRDEGKNLNILISWTEIERQVT